MLSEELIKLIFQLDQSQDIVTGNAFMSSEKIVPNAITSNRFHIPVHQLGNEVIKKHITYM